MFEVSHFYTIHPLLKAEKLLAVQAKERMLAGVQLDSGQKFAQSAKGRAGKQAAAMFGVRLGIKLLPNKAQSACLYVLSVSIFTPIPKRCRNSILNRCFHEL